MKIYIVYYCGDYDEPLALALQKKEAEKIMAIYRKSNPDSIYWIEERTLTNEAIEI